MSYIDLVACKHSGCDKPFIFQAPAWSNLRKGDEVLVETRKGQTRVTVEARELFELGSERYDFMLAISGATLPLKRVLGKYDYHEFDYKEEE